MAIVRRSTLITGAAAAVVSVGIGAGLGSSAFAQTHTKVITQTVTKTVTVAPPAPLLPDLSGTWKAQDSSYNSNGAQQTETDTLVLHQDSAGVYDGTLTTDIQTGATNYPVYTAPSDQTVIEKIKANQGAVDPGKPGHGILDFDVTGSKSSGIQEHNDYASVTQTEIDLCTVPSRGALVFSRA
ncbi:MAG TPA: hypothetical protein VHV82_06070 [Sporichthyaceae bacterium]|nr:hypothetical protein [Sporichthyaceae bacterium]